MSLPHSRGRGHVSREYRTFVEVESLSQGLCGASRPGHFREWPRWCSSCSTRLHPKRPCSGKGLPAVDGGEADGSPIWRSRQEIIGRPHRPKAETDWPPEFPEHVSLPGRTGRSPVPLSGAAGSPGAGGLEGAQSREDILAAVRQIINAPRPAPRSTSSPWWTRRPEGIGSQQARRFVAGGIGSITPASLLILCYRRPGYVACLMMKSKSHRATITQADLHYEGSITIAAELLRAADILPYEMVHVYNISNSERFETYALEGEEDSGVICLGRRGAERAVGDLIIITTYATYEGGGPRPARTQGGHGGPPQSPQKYCLG